LANICILSQVIENFIRGNKSIPAGTGVWVVKILLSDYLFSFIKMVLLPESILDASSAKTRCPSFMWYAVTFN